MQTVIRFLLATFLLHCLSVHAIPITLVHEGAGAGSLDGNAFDAAFTIVATSDTDLYYGSRSGGTLPHLTTTISIAGVGVFDILVPIRTFLNRSEGVIGMAIAEGRIGDLFDGPREFAFRSWDMVSSLGPVSGVGRLLQWDYPGVVDPVFTSAGRLIFADQESDWRFTAIVDTPASQWLLVLGLGALGYRQTRRTRG